MSAIIYINNTYAQDEQSNKILGKLSYKIKNAKSIASNFTLKVKSSDGKTKGTYTGNLIMKNDKYVVDIGSQKIINNGKTLYTYLVENKEVQIANYDAKNDAISPSKLFSGKFSTDYNYNFAGETTFNGKACYAIALRPKVANRIFTKIYLYVDKQTDFVTGGNVYEKNGNYYQYIINSIYTNKSVPDNYFDFDVKKYKGVEVIDLR